MDSLPLTKKEVFVVLDKFKNRLLNEDENVIYPFNALDRLNKKYFEFAQNEGRIVVKAFVFKQDLSYQILDYLCGVSKIYLAKNRVLISDEAIRENWSFVLGMSLSLISKAIPFDQGIFNRQVDSFMQARD